MGPRFPDEQSSTNDLSDLTSVRFEAAPPDTAGRVGPDHDLAETARIHRQRPRSLLLLTRFTISIWRRPWMSRRAIRALVAEQEGAEALPKPARATHGEVVVYSIARRKANGVLTRHTSD